MFRFEDNKCYSMPAHFGGSVFDPDAKAVYNDLMTVQFRYTTDGDKLSQYIPEGFELLKPELSIMFQQCRQVEWMGGSYYNLIWVGAPTRFKGKQDQVDGLYTLVIWENHTTPILTGREMGLPKIYADIEDLHIQGDNHRTWASYERNKFLELEMNRSQQVSEEQLKKIPHENISFGWRYVKKIGEPGAEVSQPVLFPAYNEPARAWTGTGSVKWTPVTQEQHPLQWFIINPLTELPIIEMKPANMVQGRGILSDPKARVLK